MKPLARNVLIGYGAFCAVNLAVSYMTSSARTGRQLGQNKLLDFNDSLLPFNVLARVLSQSTGALIPAAAASSGAMPGQPTFLPDRSTQTVFPTGTTTLF